MSDPLVRIAKIDEEAERLGQSVPEYQVFKSTFENVYKDQGYKITFMIGESEGPNEVAPPAPETSTAHVEPQSAVDAAPVSDAPAPESTPAPAPRDGSEAEEATETPETEAVEDHAFTPNA